MIRFQYLPVRRTGTLAAMSMLLLAACGTGGPPPSPDSATANRPSPSPTATRSAAEGFWSRLGVEAMGPRYGSLAEIGRASDAIVVGRVTAVRFSYEQRDGEFSSVYYGEVRLAVGQVLKGDLLEPGVVRLQVLIGSPDMVEDLQRLLPPGRVLLFLFDPLRDSRGSRYDPGLRESLRGQYVLTNLDQSVVIEVGGMVAPPPYSLDPFLVELAGRPFDEVVEEVRAAAR